MPFDELRDVLDSLSNASSGIFEQSLGLRLDPTSSNGAALLCAFDGEDGSLLVADSGAELNIVEAALLAPFEYWDFLDIMDGNLFLGRYEVQKQLINVVFDNYKVTVDTKLRQEFDN